MDIFEMISKYKLGGDGEDKSGFEKEFRETFKHETELNKKQNEIEALKTQLNTLNETVKKFDGVDVDGLKNEITTLKTKHDQELTQLKLESALEMELHKNEVRNTKAVKALLNVDIVKLDGETLIGLKEQIDKLKETDSYLFKAKEQEQPKGMIEVGQKQTEVTTVTKEQFDKMNYIEKVKLFNQNPELYKSFI